MKLPLGTLVVLALIISNSALAAGFDDRYTVRRGDFNSDGLQDLYVGGPGPLVIPLDDIPVFVPASVREFVLQNAGNGTFTLATTLTATQRNTMRQWPVVAFDKYVRDVNQDGRDDLELIGIKSEITGAADYIVYAGASNGSAPLGLTLVNARFNKYHAEVEQWLLNENYFNENAPLKVVSVTPGAPRFWSWTTPDPSNLRSISQGLQYCRSQHPGFTCGVTSMPPSPCVQRVRVLYEDGIVRTEDRDLCQYSTHIWAFDPPSVTLAQDYGVFEPDSRETADILKRLRLSCPSFNPTDASRLGAIVSNIYGPVVGPPINVPNSIPHPLFPGDILFTQGNQTFHHYDVLTQVCTASQPSCNLTAVRDDVFRYFTYPAKQLKPTLTLVNGTQHVMAYITTPFSTGISDLYVLEAGTVTQSRVVTPPWTGATQNVTDAAHIVFPGTISRYVSQNAAGVEIFTHGIGTNRAFCSSDQPIQNRAFQMLLGFSNDVFGKKAFKQLDREMIKYYKSHYVPPFTGEASDPCADVNNCSFAPDP